MYTRDGSRIGRDKEVRWRAVEGEVEKSRAVRNWNREEDVTVDD